jgi:hypothetical protein
VSFKSSLQNLFIKTLKFKKMKNLKFVGLILLGFVMTLSSCNKSDVDPLVDGESAVLDMLFLATGEDSTQVMRGQKGKCNITEVAVEDLSATITTYITANYAGATINRAGTNDANNFTMVGITKADGTHAGLVFDADGAYVAEKSRGPKGSPIEITDLPTTISDYITANYADATIKKAFQGQDGRFGVLLVLADETYLGLGFDADGNFVGELSMKDKKGKKHGSGKKKGPFSN